MDPAFSTTSINRELLVSGGLKFLSIKRDVIRKHRDWHGRQHESRSGLGRHSPAPVALPGVNCDGLGYRRERAVVLHRRVCSKLIRFQIARYVGRGGENLSAVLCA